MVFLFFFVLFQGFRTSLFGFLGFFRFFTGFGSTPWPHWLPLVKNWFSLWRLAGHFGDWGRVFSVCKLINFFSSKIDFSFWRLAGHFGDLGKGFFLCVISLIPFLKNSFFQSVSWPAISGTGERIFSSSFCFGEMGWTRFKRWFFWSFSSLIGESPKSVNFFLWKVFVLTIVQSD